MRRAGPEREVLLVGTGKAGEWRISKGMLEPGELVPDAACREVAEETGILVAIEGFVGSRSGPMPLAVPRPDAENAVAAWVPFSTAINGMKYKQEWSAIKAALGQNSGGGAG